jgi:hypothetical protein
MQGVIQYITASQSLSRLTDENGEDRLFDHGQLTTTNIKLYDAVRFDLSGTKITNIELLKKGRRNIVFYW